MTGHALIIALLLQAIWYFAVSLALLQDPAGGK